MKEMAILAHNLFTLHFEKEVASLESAFNLLLRIVGAIDRLRNSLIGKDPLYFASDAEDLWAHLTIGICAAKEYNLLEQMEEEDAQEVRKHFLAVHKKIRKVKDLEGLEKLLSYLQRLIVLSAPEKTTRPTITSNDETLFFFQPTSGSAWIAIEKGDKGFVVKGESDFMAYPGSVIAYLTSKEYQVSTTVMLMGGVKRFMEYLSSMDEDFGTTKLPGGEIIYRLKPEAKYESFRLLNQPNGLYVVEAKKADEKPSNKPTRQQQKRHDPSAGKPGRPAHPKR